MGRIETILATVLALAATNCERSSGQKKKHDSTEDRPIELKPTALICPNGIGLGQVGWSIVPMMTPQCPVEVVLFGMGANACAIGGSCQRPCEVVESSQIGDDAQETDAYWRFTYDSEGHPIKLEKRDGKDERKLEVTWTWTNGRVVVQDENAKSTGRDITNVKYTNGGRRAEIDFGGEMIIRELDDAGRLIKHGESSYVVENGRTVGIQYEGSGESGTRFHYDERGQVVAIDFPMSVRHEYTYDERGLVISESVSTGNTTIEAHHEHDKSGRLLVSKRRIGSVLTQLSYQYECQG